MNSALPNFGALDGLALVAYDVSTSATYTGPIDICFTLPVPVDKTLFDTLKIFHLENGNYVDRTIYPSDPHQPNFATQTLCSRTSSMSPFVIAVPVGARIGNFVAFSRDATVLANRVTVVSGDVGANMARVHSHDKTNDGDRDDVTVQVGSHVTMLRADSRVVGDTVSLGNKASVYHVLTNSLLNHRGTVIDDVQSGMTLPYLSLPAFPTITPGIRP